MPGRSLKASSARPSQTPLEGRADDASCLTSNTVAHPVGTVVANDKSDNCAAHLLSQRKASEGMRRDRHIAARRSFATKRRSG